MTESGVLEEQVLLAIQTRMRYNRAVLGMSGFDGEGWTWMASRGGSFLVNPEQGKITAKNTVKPAFAFPRMAASQMALAA